MLDISDVQERYREHGWWRDETFLDDLRRGVKQTPDKPALIAYRRGTEKVISYAELARITDDFAAKLTALGVRRGDAVAVHLPSWWELLPLALACARIGAIFCPLMIIYRKREIEFILRMTGARVCVTMATWEGVRLAEVVGELFGELPELKYLFAAGGEAPACSRSFEEYFHGAPVQLDDEPEWRETAADDPFLLLFTSGTTGESKGSIHTQNTLYASSVAYAEALGLDDDTITFGCAAATHYSGFVTGVLTALMVGGTSVLIEAWDVDAFLEIAPKSGITVLYGAPNFLLQLLAAHQASPVDLSSIRYLVSGSAPIPPSVVQRVRAGLGIPVVALWGMTENGAVTITRQDDPADWAEHSDGRVLGGMEARIDAIEGSQDGAGALWVRGPSQCLGYYKRDELYAAALDADGWFDTGDLARDDGRGGVRITGRTKDIVLHHSVIVPVGDAENALLRHPQVRDVAVISLPGDGDEVTCAVVVPDGEPPTLGALRDHLTAEGFSTWFLPGQVEIVDSLPRTITGKVRKVDLRQRFGGG